MSVETLPEGLLKHHVLELCGLVGARVIDVHKAQALSKHRAKAADESVFNWLPDAQMHWQADSV
jgi:hypothetical protein